MNTKQTIQVTDLTEARRTTLAEWQAELTKLADQRRRTHYRTRNRQLCIHLASAIQGAYSAIDEACTPARNELVAAAVTAVVPYFERPNDARRAALQFSALEELATFLRCPDTDLTLAELAALADATAALLEKLLAGEVIWRFQGAANELPFAEVPC